MNHKIYISLDNGISNEISPPAPVHVDEDISYPPQTQEPTHVYQNIQSFGNDPFAAQPLAIEETPAFDDPFGNAPMNTQPPAANDDWANGLDQFEDAFGGTAEYSAPPVASDDPWGNQQGQTVAQTNDDPWGQTQQTYDSPPAYQQPDTPGWNTPFGNTKVWCGLKKSHFTIFSRRMVPLPLRLHQARTQHGTSSSTLRGSTTSS